MAKSRKAKTDDPSPNKLMFPSAEPATADSATADSHFGERRTTTITRHYCEEKGNKIPVQMAINFPTKSRKRACKTAKHDFSFSGA